MPRRVAKFNFVDYTTRPTVPRRTSKRHRPDNLNEWTDYALTCIRSGDATLLSWALQSQVVDGSHMEALLAAREEDQLALLKVLLEAGAPFVFTDRHGTMHFLPYYIIENMFESTTLKDDLLSLCLRHYSERSISHGLYKPLLLSMVRFVGRCIKQGLQKSMNAIYHNCDLRCYFDDVFHNPSHFRSLHLNNDKTRVEFRDLGHLKTFVDRLIRVYGAQDVSLQFYAYACYTYLLASVVYDWKVLFRCLGYDTLSRKCLQHLWTDAMITYGDWNIQGSDVPLLPLLESYHCGAWTRAVFFEFLTESEMKHLLRRDMQDDFAQRKARYFLQLHADLASDAMLGYLVKTDAYQAAHRNAQMLVLRESWTPSSHYLFPDRVHRQIRTLLAVIATGPWYLAAVDGEVWKMIFKRIAENDAVLNYNVYTMSEEQRYEHQPVVKLKMVPFDVGNLPDDPTRPTSNDARGWHARLSEYLTPVTA